MNQNQQTPAQAAQGSANDKKAEPDKANQPSLEKMLAFLLGLYPNSQLQPLPNLSRPNWAFPMPAVVPIVPLDLTPKFETFLEYKVDPNDPSAGTAIYNSDRGFHVDASNPNNAKAVVALAEAVGLKELKTHPNVPEKFKEELVKQCNDKGITLNTPAPAPNPRPAGQKRDDQNQATAAPQFTPGRS